MFFVLEAVLTPLVELPQLNLHVIWFGLVAAVLKHLFVKIVSQQR